MTSNSILSLFQFVSLPESVLSAGPPPRYLHCTTPLRHYYHFHKETQIPLQLRHHHFQCPDTCHLQSEKRAKLSARARAKDLFDDLDKDGDGELTMGEFVEGYLQMMVQA